MCHCEPKDDLLIGIPNNEICIHEFVPPSHRLRGTFSICVCFALALSQGTTDTNAKTDICRKHIILSRNTLRGMHFFDKFHAAGFQILYKPVLSGAVQSTLGVKVDWNVAETVLDDCFQEDVVAAVPCILWCCSSKRSLSAAEKYALSSVGYAACDLLGSHDRFLFSFVVLCTFPVWSICTGSALEEQKLFHFLLDFVLISAVGGWKTTQQDLWVKSAYSPSLLFRTRR